MPWLARGMIAIAGLSALLGLFADFIWEKTARLHMRNPQWPPHAKFHNAHGIVMGIASAVAVLFILFGLQPMTRSTAIAAACTAAIFWIAVPTAKLFPGTSWSDEVSSGREHRSRRVAVQAQLAFFILGWLALAVVLLFLD